MQQTCRRRPPRRRSGGGWSACPPQRSWRSCRPSSPCSPPPRACPGYVFLVIVTFTDMDRGNAIDTLNPTNTPQNRTQDRRSRPFGCLTQRGLESMRQLGRSLRDLHPTLLRKQEPPTSSSSHPPGVAFQVYSSNFARTQQSAQGLLHGLRAHELAAAPVVGGGGGTAEGAAAAVPVVVREVRRRIRFKRRMAWTMVSPKPSNALLRSGRARSTCTTTTRRRSRRRWARCCGRRPSSRGRSSRR